MERKRETRQQARGQLVGILAVLESNRTENFSHFLSVCTSKHSFAALLSHANQLDYIVPGKNFMFICERHL